ncbi:HD domain-containing protein [Candidatus Peregrinibacteria bacterium]|nr:HD domain-containing protein [Candidatus Peregrinibacteria bacterium]
MTDDEVSGLIEEFHMPLHVQRHCAAVANFAKELGKKLIAAGEKMDLKLLHHAALLHDLVRVVDFKKFEPEEFPDPISAKDIAFWKMLREKYKGLHHAEAGARILEERGFKEIARLVRSHRFLQIKEGFNSWEEKILYYADKRTKHDKVVTLKERLADGRQRNAPETENTKEAAELDEKVFTLEREILTKIGEAKPID